MNILLSIIDCLKILAQAIRFSILNIAIENNHSLLIRILGYVNPFYIFNRKIPPGLRIKNFLESLGPMFIKFGQLLLNDGVWNEERIISSSFIQQIKDLTTYGLKFWYASNNFVTSASPSVSKFIFANGFDGQYILIDFENNIIVARNSLYYPSLDISQTKKMITGSLGTTNFTVTVPTIITTNGETRLNQNFNPFTMLYNLYSQ